jgi:glycosyltransferase involved in cell wall biosynthesis
MQDAPRSPRIAIVVSHPIQHFCPQYASLASDGDWHVKVFFASSAGKTAYSDPGFGREIKWDTLYLDEFEHEFMSNDALPITSELDAPDIGRYLEVYDPQVVIIYGYWQKFQNKAKAWATRKNRLIYYISDVEIAERRGWLSASLKILLNIYHLRGVNRLLTVGDHNEHFYQMCGFGLQKMTRMHFPIDRKRYEEAYGGRVAARQTFREKHKIHDSSLVVGNVGKFVPWKRQKDLIKALREVGGATNIVVALAGSGPDEGVLRRLAEDVDPGRIVFLGFITPEELPGFYAACDIYAHVSSKEPHSLAISEAAFMGLPILLSDGCGSYGTWDDLRPGINGFAYEVGNTGALGRTLKILANNRRILEQFSVASRNYAVEGQSISHGGFLRAALLSDGLIGKIETRK